MIPGAEGTLGGGIYFADSVTAAQSKATSTGYLVVADVHTGRALTVDQTVPQQSEWTWNSWHGWLLAFLFLAVAALVINGATWIYQIATDASGGDTDLVDMIGISSPFDADIMGMMDMPPPIESWTGGDFQTCFRALQEAGYDSIYGTGFDDGPEYVVFNPDQVEILEVREM